MMGDNKNISSNITYAEAVKSATAAIYGMANAPSAGCVIKKCKPQRNEYSNRCASILNLSAVKQVFPHRYDKNNK